MGACGGTYLDDVVGRAYDVFVVLYHNNGIADVTQFLEDMDESLGVAAMHANGRLVEDVK